MPNALETLIEAIDNTYILKITKRKAFLRIYEKKILWSIKFCRPGRK
jgi:hypothetical protein